MPRSLIAEVFAPGTWNGMPFSVADLSSIVEAFNKLKDVHKVPLKFGHNDGQPMTDGQPAIGWVDDLFIDSGKDGKQKLMARFADMPEVVFNAIKKKLYRKVSIELDMGVTHQKGRFDYVLSGVALLGADIPAVSVLADLTAYMSRSSMAVDKRCVFTAISTQEDTTVSDELKAQLAEIREQLKGMQEENATLKADNAAFTKAKEEREAAEAQAKVTDARTKFAKILDDAVKDERIMPAQREIFSKTLRLDDDAAVVALKEDDVTALIESVAGPAKKFSREASHGKEGGRKATGNPGFDLTEKAREIQNANPTMSFSKALERAMAADSTLAADHMADVTAED